ncbi:MAG: putative sulfate exporter family transporter, partial [Candidatus Omnitrophica bacterium]|nr:putative sulfate exporter family transporter [Candidatus Omnitrophota bacterium]
MKAQDIKSILLESWQGLGLALGIGALSVLIQVISQNAMADPLLIALILGIIARTFSPENISFQKGFKLAPKIFIPIGIIFYAARNLNFIKFYKVQPGIVILLIAVMAAYILVIFFLGKILKQKKEVTCLTAVGSAICGASAITIMAPSIDADSDDVSVSLLSVAITAFYCLFILLPFISTLLNIDDRTYGMLAGAVLQFTGLVKVAVADIPFLTVTLEQKALAKLALSVKAFRYVGLLVAIPLFASLSKKKIYIPWVLWVFLGCGILGTILQVSNEIFYTNVLFPVIKPIYDF